MQRETTNPSDFEIFLMNQTVKASRPRNQFAAAIARCLEFAIRTATTNVWPNASDRARYAERRAVDQDDESHELEWLFGSVHGNRS